ncbi:MAG TPA: beta-glucosidase BglX [Thermoanaerobaculia bacterium]|nr:beta-glucosidase BglX [Thermoanaerobaculia bacterium]
MIRTARTLLVLLALAAPLAAQPVDQRVEALLARMTLEEKLGQLIQFTPGRPDTRELVANGSAGCIFNLGGAAQLNELQRIAVEQSRLKIPLLFAHDVIHGFRTIFPIPPGIASTWDPSSAELTARVAAREASASGVRWTFAPMVDIARDPRWGRVAEGAGEDPVLGSAMAAAYVRGYQGKDLSAPDSILACAKHFVAYGAAEAGRDYNTTDLSERTLREIYFPPFKAAVDAGVWTIMTAFNAVNGVPATASRWLMTGVLRDEWGFRGFVDSDYEAIEQLIPHGVAGSPQEAALKSITAGVDMDMIDMSYLTLAEAVRDGRLAPEVVDESVRRVLRAKFALGLFDRPYADEKREKAMVLAAEHVAAARRIAQKSIVLLKNEGGLLPLSKSGGALAVVGPLADSREDMLGSWHAHGKPEEAVALLEAIRAKLGANREVIYAKGTDVLEGTAEGIAEAVAAANKAAVVLLVLGEQGKMSGEANSRAFLDLPGRQQELLEAVMATGKPVALVVMSGRPLTIPWAAERVPAIVWPWFPGTQGGHALADVLFGDVNPSAKLPITFPRSVGQIPIYYNHLPTGRPEDPEKKYTSKYIDSPNDPLYPFGYGLSYTTFRYTDLRVTNEGAGVKVSANVTNSGTRAGDEVVQLYVNDPVATTSRPVRELKGFRRVSLAPGQSRRVEFTLTPADLQIWVDGGWKFEPGTFRVWIGDQEGKFDLNLEA